MNLPIPEQYQQHALSAAFPPMTDAEYAEFRADVAANGVLHAIILFEGKVLDGWHRQRAGHETGHSLRFEQFPGDAAAALRYVIAANLRRRQLNESQRAMIAAHLVASAKLPVVGAAELLNVSERTVKDATQVVGSGNTALIDQVEAGAVAVSKAAQTVRANKPKPVTPPRQTVGPYTVPEWRTLSPEARPAALVHRNPHARLNRENPGEDDNLIDWARWSLNVIAGCEHDCPYCYAHDIAERFRGTSAYPNGFTPMFHPERLAAPLNQAPPVSDDPRDGRIFLGSMADMFGRWVPKEWIEAVLDVVRLAPGWTFLALTKFPGRLPEFDFPPNLWIGTSVDLQARVTAAEAAFKKVNATVKWLSVEPMLEPLQFTHLERFDLVVIGGASQSARTPRWVPPFEWIAALKRQADTAGCAVYEKSNLLRKEAPGDTRLAVTDTAPNVFHYLGKGAVAVTE
jgi:protein gp37